MEDRDDPPPDDLPWNEAGEDLNYIRNLTVKNLRDMPFPQFLETLRPYVLEQVPEGIMGDKEALRKVDQQIGRFANLYGYLAYLYSFAGSEGRRLKPVDKGAYESMMAKKDALYRLIQAVELKWRACSRQVTVETEGEVDFDRPNYRARQERAEDTKPIKGWGAVR